MKTKKIEIPQAKEKQIGNSMKYFVDKIPEKFRKPIFYIFLIIVIIVITIIAVTQQFY